MTTASEMLREMTEMYWTLKNIPLEQILGLVFLALSGLIDIIVFPEYNIPNMLGRTVAEV